VPAGMLAHGRTACRVRVRVSGQRAGRARRGRRQGGDLLDWTSDSGIQEQAFIQRIEALSTMGYSVLLSNYRRYFKLAAYLSTFTQESIVIALGLPSLVVRPGAALRDARRRQALQGGQQRGLCIQHSRSGLCWAHVSAVLSRCRWRQLMCQPHIIMLRHRFLSL